MMQMIISEHLYLFYDYMTTSIIFYFTFMVH